MTDITPLSDGTPAGPNLELDPAFGELERAAQGKPESQYGETIEPEVPPDWKDVAALAEALLERTRDLRVLALLAVARLHLQGIAAYAAVIGQIRQQIETAWEHVHPRLDPEDDNDPVQRSNALLVLTDPVRVMRLLRDAPLASTPRTGPVSWRDIAILSGAQEPEPGREKIAEAAVRAAFAGSDPVGQAALRAAVAGGIGDLAAISAAFDAHAAPGSGPDFDDLTKLLRDINKDLLRFTTFAADDLPNEAARTPQEDSTPEHPRTRAGSIQSIAALSSRDDALHALELAAAYFRANEPSSPLPLLIDRAKRLAPLPFLEILRDLAPDGLLQAQNVIGGGGV